MKHHRRTLPPYEHTLFCRAARWRSIRLSPCPSYSSSRCFVSVFFAEENEEDYSHLLNFNTVTMFVHTCFGSYHVHATAVLAKSGFEHWRLRHLGYLDRLFIFVGLDYNDIENNIEKHMYVVCVLI